MCSSLNVFLVTAFATGNMVITDDNNRTVVKNNKAGNFDDIIPDFWTDI